MARDFVINGETMVSVTQAPAGAISSLSKLGLSTGQIVIHLIFHHQNVTTDDFGPLIPAEVLWMMAEAHIEMTLVHYDSSLLEQCVQESMAGSSSDGTLVGAGRPMGGLHEAGLSTNHYISLNIGSTVKSRPWRFPSSYLANHPMVLPLGTNHSQVRLNWRAIPYRALNTAGDLPPDGFELGNEIKSTGVILWDHIPDTL